jgi:Tetratricopeptide repeat
VLTSVAIGFGIYVWRLTSRSRAILDIMKQATDEGGRQRALEALSGEGQKDAMKALARSQLLAQTDPLEAQKVLEAVDIKKAPTVLQDDLRAQLAMLYLRNGRTREARTLTDEIRLDRRPDAKSKGLYAAVMAEALARTGSGDEARKLLETYKPEESEHDEVRVMLLRSQVYTFVALKKRGLAKRAMDALCEVEPNLLGSFLLKGSQPEIAKLARQALAESGAAPKMKIKRMP